jgi:hypothetical protein
MRCTIRMGVIDTRNREAVQNKLKLGLANKMGGHLNLNLPKPKKTEPKVEKHKSLAKPKAVYEEKVL